MNSKILNWMDDTTGQSVVELALIMPVLLFLLFGILFLGFWMNAQQIVTQAAYQGARQGAITNNDIEIQNAIKESMKSLSTKNGGEGGYTVNIVPPFASTERKYGKKITVTITYTMPFMLPFLHEIIPSNVASTISVINECFPLRNNVVCDYTN